MYWYLTLPSENMFGHTIQANVVTAYPSINREVRYLLAAVRFSRVHSHGRSGIPPAFLSADAA
jgi:hypothetical protein